MNLIGFSTRYRLCYEYFNTFLHFWNTFTSILQFFSSTLFMGNIMLSSFHAEIMNHHPLLAVDNQSVFGK